MNTQECKRFDRNEAYYPDKRLILAGATTAMIVEVSGLTVAEVEVFGKAVRKGEKEKPADG